LVHHRYESRYLNKTYFVNIRFHLQCTNEVVEFVREAARDNQV